MDEPTPVETATAFKDRRGGLIAFGIVLILIGCVCALLVGMMAVTQTLMQATAPGSRPPAAPFAGGYRSMLPVVVMYGGLAVVFIWLGIGSILTRRWVPPLVLILSWTWMITGIIAVVGAAVFLPIMLSSRMPPGSEPMPDGARTAIVASSTGCLAVFFVLLPVAFVLFYRSRHVKATCDARDPVVRWTDACPPSVLGLSLALGFGAVSFPFMMVLNPPVVPCFGMLLSGAPAAAALLVMAVAWVYCAWATYKMKPEGWWATVIVFAVTTVSGLITFWRVDLIEMYRLMDYPEEQIAQIQQFSFLTSRDMLLWMAVGSLLMFGYLLYVKKYFRRPA